MAVNGAACIIWNSEGSSDVIDSGYKKDVLFDAQKAYDEADIAAFPKSSWRGRNP